jgi:hypothetical protein
VPPHTPAAGAHPEVYDVLSQGYDAATGHVTVSQVYGGNLIVGMSSQPSTTSNPPPYYGGFASIAARAKGNATTTTVSVGNSTIAMNLNDFELQYFVDGDPYGALVGPTDNIYGTICNATSCLGQSGNFSIQHNDNETATLLLDQFNPWGLPSTSLTFCTLGTNQCFPIVSGATETTDTPFFTEPGLDEGYWGFSPGGGATTSVSYPPGNGIGPSYGVSYSGGLSGYITLDAVFPFFFYRGQTLEISTTAPAGTIFFLDPGCGGVPYQSTGVTSSSGAAGVTLSSLPGLLQCQSLSVGYTLPAGSPTSGSFDIFSILPAF